MQQLITLIAAVIAFLATMAAIDTKKQWGLIEDFLFLLITNAEREFGGGTGQLKLISVLEKAYPHIPPLIKMILTSEQLKAIINKALETAKTKWKQNPKLLQ